jgi:hypothetical protein
MVLSQRCGPKVLDRLHSLASLRNNQPSSSQTSSTVPSSGDHHHKVLDHKGLNSKDRFHKIPSLKVLAHKALSKGCNMDHLVPDHKALSKALVSKALGHQDHRDKGCNSMGREPRISRIHDSKDHWDHRDQWDLRDHASRDQMVIVNKVQMVLCSQGPPMVLTAPKMQAAQQVFGITVPHKASHKARNKAHKAP